MPDNLLILVVLLLAAAVVYGYFYLKRAQARPTDVAATSGSAPATEAAHGESTMRDE
jgi:Flp pilus assembly protein CpaB